MDKADLIAGYAREHNKQVLTMGYGVDQVIEAQADDILAVATEEKSHAFGLG